MSNLTLLDHFFEKTSRMDWIRPQAGSIAFPNLTKNSSSERFCTHLIDKAGVLLLPSSAFMYGDNHFRIGFGRKNMPEALNSLDNYLKSQ